MALLREIYGSGAEKVKIEHRNFKTPTGRVVEVTTLGSNYHIECSAGDAGTADRFVIQEVIKEIASHGTLTSAAASTSSQGGARSVGFKVVLLTEVDRLSRQAQAGLRRTMEK
jgi:replication factor C subunit 3/5